MRYLVFMALMLAFVSSVQAQDTSKANSQSEPIMVINNAPSIEKSVVFLDSKSAIFPSCDDEELQKQIQYHIKEYEKQYPQKSVDERRHQMLNLKNTSGFSAISISEFKPKQNRDVANRIISLKLNELIGEKDMRLCFQKNRISEKTVYLLMYRKADAIKVEILGYLPRNTSKPVLFFDYQV